MSAGSSIEDYLAQGGVIAAPDNMPARYRAELLRIMASFVDSELAGAAGFADLINDGPGITERIVASRIVLEKTAHAESVLKIMGSLGADIDRYSRVHPWTKRVDRCDDLGAERPGGDMRLNVFYYPIECWTDAVVMNVLMGKATLLQLQELKECSYQPLAEVFHDILPREKRHMEYGVDGVARLLANGVDTADVVRSFDYWRPRVAASFGGTDSKRFDMLKRLGIRRRPNSALRAEWQAEIERYSANLLGGAA